MSAGWYTTNHSGFDIVAYVVSKGYTILKTVSLSSWHVGDLVVGHSIADISLHICEYDKEIVAGYVPI